MPHQAADANAKTNEERVKRGIYSLLGKYLQINASSELMPRASLQREIYTAIYILINFLLLHYEFPSVSVISARFPFLFLFSFSN